MLQTTEYGRTGPGGSRAMSRVVGAVRREPGRATRPSTEGKTAKASTRSGRTVATTRVQVGRFFFGVVHTTRVK